MKRMFLSVMMVLGMSTVSFSKSLLVFNDGDMEMNLPKLVRYLDVNSSQYDAVANAMDYFSDKMQRAKYFDRSSVSKKLYMGV